MTSSLNRMNDIDVADSVGEMSVFLSRHLRFSGVTILIKMMSMSLTNLTSSIVNNNQNAFKPTYQAIQGKYSEVFASRTP